MHIYFHKELLKELYKPLTFSWIYKLFSHMCSIIDFIHMDLNLSLFCIFVRIHVS